MTAPTQRVCKSQTLRSQFEAFARAENLSLSSYLVRLVRADVNRRLANAAGLSWRVSHAEQADTLIAAISAPLSDIEQAYLPADPIAALAYAAGRARKRSGSSKPSPSPATKPAPSPGTRLVKRVLPKETGPRAWHASVKASLAKGAVRITGQTLELRAARADSLPAEFRLFVKGANDSTKGAVLFDSRAAELVMAQARRHGVDFMLDLEHRSLFAQDETHADAMGWFTPEVRNGELWATRISWTDVGAERLRSRRQRYTSPAFYCAEFDDKAQLPRVTSLINCAICSMPATYQIAPLVASQNGGAK